jgi:DNA-damage-inducible protein D
LTDEWSVRGVSEGTEYSILTAEIARATFGLTPSEHKVLKKLTKPTQNLRDHMTNLELIFTALGKEVTRKLAIEDNAKGFDENRETARKGGDMAGQARLKIEELGMKVVSDENFLHLKTEPKTKELPKKTDSSEAK